MGCWRPMTDSNEGEGVLRRLRVVGVAIKLDGESHSNVIGAIQTFLNRYEQRFWSFLAAEITRAIVRELFRSRNLIDAKLLEEVIEQVQKEKEEEEDSEDEEEEEEANLQIIDLKDPTTRSAAIESLLYLAGKEGLKVKEGDEEAILDLMNPYMRGVVGYTSTMSVILERVKLHIVRCSTLDSFETVETALQGQILYEKCSVVNCKECPVRVDDWGGRTV